MPDPRMFLPSTDGFAFPNSWPSQPAVSVPTPFGTVNIGDASAGLCGGMVFLALDFWHARALPPADKPGLGSPVYEAIVRRLVDSWNIPSGIAQYYQWMNLPDGDSGFDLFGRHVLTQHGVSWRSVEAQWPQVKADLDLGAPSPLGLVTVASSSPKDLAHNHQVLACGYRVVGSVVTIQVYDPNSGQLDDVWIRFDTSDPTKPTSFQHNVGMGHPIRGFFRTGYAPEPPPTA